MQSPMQNKIDQFKKTNSCKVFLFNKLSRQYPHYNPLAILDTVEEIATRQYMYEQNICCACERTSTSLILTLIDNCPVKYCSLKCMQQNC